MDCSVFRKRLNDLIEENIDFDLKEAMLEHVEKCEPCKSLYKEELAIEESFRAAFSIDAGNFRSLRPEIMKSIDKNRYGKNPFKRLLNHIKRYKANYTALVAVAAAIIFITPYIANEGLGNGATKSALPETKAEGMPSTKNAAMKSDTMKTTETYDSAKDEARNEMAIENSNSFRGKDETKDLDYMPNFEKKTLEKGFQVSFNIPWETSKGGKYAATVEGIGEEAQEEGIGTIVLKDKAGQQWSFELLNNYEKQYTPKKLKWIDDENLLITVGYGQGLVNIGGELYILNVETNGIMKPNPNNIKAGTLAEITKIISVKKLEKNKLKIDVELLVYEDDNFSVSHKENRTITTQSLDK